VSPTQEAVFQSGSGVAPDTLLTAIAASVLVLAFVWVIRITLGTFRAWQDGQATLLEVSWSAIRASIVLMVLGFYLR
jgi:integrating conjugative element protein (TIGR03758 family)